MSKVFNSSAACRPNLHYMVNLDSRLDEIKSLVDKGEYFTINRARQYGKTTTLRALALFLKEEYLVVSLDFQKLGDAKFRNENVFSIAFANVFVRGIKQSASCMDESLKAAVTSLEAALRTDEGRMELLELFFYLSDICGASAKPVVLIIDEVDSATNNQVFLDFLAQLRAYYIDREDMPTFRSVILAGVYDVKNLKQKLRPNDAHKVNSPWNIAADFNVVMSFSVTDIKGMLLEYEADHSTGMDVENMAEMLVEYTSGYPFLVSRLCKIIDEILLGSQQYPNGREAWTPEGLRDAVKLLLVEKNTLFESLVGKLNDYPGLREMIYSILFTGKNVAYNPDNEAVDMAVMFGFVKNQKGNVAIANRIFETRLYNLFLSENEMQTTDIYKAALQDKNQFIQDGHLDMERECL